MSAFISIEEAAQLLQQPNVVWLDAQFNFGQSAQAYELYHTKHIPGATYFHLDEHMSGPILQHGGRHPVPETSFFEGLLQAAGVNNESLVIVYDNTGGATAARLWWLLKYFGHENVRMLAQPITHWEEAGYPVTTDIPTHRLGNFQANVQASMQVDMENVYANLQNEERMLIDARVEDVYTGERATKYPKVGHIPGAVNIFWERLLDEEKRLTNTQKIDALKAEKDKEIVVYCGAGVTACANIIALQEAGYTNVKLYTGSWGDWSSYEHTPSNSEAAND